MSETNSVFPTQSILRRIESERPAEQAGVDHGGLKPRQAAPRDTFGRVGFGRVKANDGLGVLVVAAIGCVSWVASPVASPVAWYLGNRYLARCRADGIEPTQSGIMGREIGKVLTLVTAGVLLSRLLSYLILKAAASSRIRIERASPTEFDEVIIESMPEPPIRRTTLSGPPSPSPGRSARDSFQTGDVGESTALGLVGELAIRTLVGVLVRDLGGPVRLSY